MADIPLTDVAGSSSAFRVVDTIVATIASDVIGDILTITAPARSIVELTGLQGTAVAAETNVELIVDGNSVSAFTTLSGTSFSSSQFMVSEFLTSASESTSSRFRSFYKTIRGKQIIVNKAVAVTANTINYSYRILEPIT